MSFLSVGAVVRQNFDLVHQLIKFLSVLNLFMHKLTDFGFQLRIFIAELNSRRERAGGFVGTFGSLLILLRLGLNLPLRLLQVVEPCF